MLYWIMIKDNDLSSTYVQSNTKYLDFKNALPKYILKSNVALNNIWQFFDVY